MKQFERVYIIAEAGVNHNGSLDIAKELIDIAAVAGVDAIKFQTFKAENLVSTNAPKAKYQTLTTGNSESQYEMLKKLELDYNGHLVLHKYCSDKGIQFLSTPFDFDSLELLVNEFDVPKLKVSSGDITNAPLLLKMAQSGKPIILSTGMSTLGEIETALGVLAFGYSRSTEAPSIKGFRSAFISPEGQGALKEKVSLLHCTTEYPAPFRDVNLRAMDTLRAAFGLPVGFSDHTPGISVPIAAVARGAIIIEKHFTVDKNLPGPDHAASLDPLELTEMVKAIREVELSLGSSLKLPAESEEKNAPVARKSIVAACDIKQGEKFSSENICVKRPGNGVGPIHYWDYLGQVANRDYRKDELINT